MMSLLYFGRFSDIGNSGLADVPDSVTDTDSLTAWLCAEYDGFESEMLRAGARIAVNKTVITENTPLIQGDEIAFMSALSGG
ncbi:MoaD/ThiS family protein [Litorimonas sp. RW-G-Af-16]|uniref:MoaD/ThiS family protein n=1 Tax=Litorimonas sp. RW-G-Af-16 TaxID=3241168 RepID=UPI00390CD53D